MQLMIFIARKKKKCVQDNYHIQFKIRHHEYKQNNWLAVLKMKHVTQTNVNSKSKIKHVPPTLKGTLHYT